MKALSKKLLPIGLSMWFSALSIKSYCIDVENAPFPNITMITENYAPISHVVDGMPSGFAVELLSLVLVELGSQQTINDIQVMPWARAFRVAQTKPLTLLFSTVYNQNRKSLFYWAGETHSSQTVVFAKKSLSLNITSIKQLKSMRLAVIRDDIANEVLTSKGFESKNVVKNTEPSLIIDMARMDRVDGFVTAKSVGDFYLNTQSTNKGEFEIVFTLQKHKEYFVFSKTTPLYVVEGFTEALEAVKMKSEYQNLLNKYPAIK